MELKTMVDATIIQWEANAHKSSLILAKEYKELHMKLKVKIEDNN